MSKVFFSSWNRKLNDERNKNLEERMDLQDLEVPSQLAGQNLKAFIGWAGMIIVDPQVDIVEALKEYYQNMQNESCGRCIPCRAGSKVIADRLEKLISGKGSKEDLTFLKEISGLIKDSSLCELGMSSPVPLLDALEYFEADFKAYLKEDRPAAGNGLTYRPMLTAPCRNGCPAHINIPRYIECIKEGDYEGALAVNREKTPLVGTLGRVCVHPCEENCNRQPYDQSLSIRLLKRFAADFGSKNNYDQNRQPAKPGADAAKVAVIGAGPAGLNCAYQLAQKGYAVTIYEALPVAGGMLAVGIPSYRLPRDILNAEVGLVESLGVEIKYNTEVGKDITIEQLWDQGYKAIFVANGLHESTTMGCKGEEEGYEGYMPGVEYLRKINLGEKVDLGEKIAVIGGGNVAMDCARSALRLGVKEVYLIYRRSRTEMPANEAEVDAAEEEGIIFHMLANPTCILEEDSCVSGLECIKMRLGEPDESGRRRPKPIEGTEHVLEVDTVIPAIGQVADFCYVTPECGLEVTKKGTLNVNPQTMETDTPGLFAGGDVVHGAATVIEAIASANRAAEAIDSYIRTGKSSVGEQVVNEQHIEKMGVYKEEVAPEIIGGRIRLEEEALPVKERVEGFDEAELGFKYPCEVVNEAERCIKCLRLGMAIL
ncbi:MAG: FAD-dependent oxidoreductase [Bacillota bacterium]